LNIRCDNNTDMIQKKILQELAENQKNKKMGSEVFGVSLTKDVFKPGKSLKVIVREMKKASTEKLFRISDDASFCN